MVEHIKSLIWYSALLVLFFVLYHVVQSYTIVVLQDDDRRMRPTLESGLYLMDATASAVRSLEGDDIIVYEVLDQTQRVRRMFGRVLGTPGQTVSTRNGRLLVDGNDATKKPDDIRVLDTGLLVPRETVFVVFDSPKAPRIPLRDRLVPYRNILGRLRHR